MSKLNRKLPVAPKMSTHVVKTSAVPTGTTALGAPGFGRDPQSELYLLIITNMVAEETFHESADGRDSRFIQLIAHNAVHNARWTADMLPWVRGTGEHA